MDILFLIGRIIVGLFYLNSALNHFRHTDMMAQYAGSKGIPAPGAVVIITGLMLAVGGLTILTGLFPLVGIALLVIFLFGTAFLIHNFWTIEDEQTRQMEIVQFAKDLALAGSLLMFVAIDQPWPLSLSL
ncbi:MAG TPA: DoxX family protein [Anaerolineae bacterium]